MKIDVILDGNAVCLIPLEISHTEALYEALKSPEVNVFYSIIDTEWHTVKQQLICLLEKKY